MSLHSHLSNNAVASPATVRSHARLGRETSQRVDSAKSDQDKAPRAPIVLSRSLPVLDQSHVKICARVHTRPTGTISFEKANPA